MKCNQVDQTTSICYPSTFQSVKLQNPAKLFMKKLHVKNKPLCRFNRITFVTIKVDFQSVISPLL